jgi:WD40 repeat protein
MKRAVLIFLVVMVFLSWPLQATAQDGNEYPVITPENAGQVGQVAILERGWINRIAWSPEGSMLAIATPAGIWLADMLDFDVPLRLLPTHSEARSLAYSAGSMALAVGTADGTVDIMDATTGDTLHTIECSDAALITEVAINPDGSLVACSSERGLYTGIWNVTTGEELQAWSDSGPIQFLDTTLLGYGTMLWDVEANDVVASLKNGIYRDAAYSADGTGITILSNLGTEIVSLDVTTNQQYDFELKTEYLLGQQLAMSPDGQQIAVNVMNDESGSVVLLLDATTGEVEGTLENPYPNVQDMAYSPDGTLVAAATTAGSVLVWDTVSGELKRDVAGFNEGGASRGGASSDVSGICCLDFGPEGTLVVGTGGYVTTNGDIHLWDLSALERTGSFRGEGTVWDLAYSPDHSLLAVSNSFSGLRLLDAKTGETVSTLDAQGDTLGVAFSPDGTFLAAVYSDGSAQLWNVTTGEPGPLQPAMSDKTGDSITFSSAGGLVAFNNQLWDTTTGEVRVIGEEWIDDLAFSPDGSLLAAASWSDDSLIQVWEVADGSLKYTLEGSRSVAFSPDGSILASGASDGRILLWDTAQGELIGTLQGHSGGVSNLAFSPDGTLLASGGFDGTVRLWACKPQ